MRGLLYKEFTLNKISLFYLGLSIVMMSSLLVFPYVSPDEKIDTGTAELFSALFGTFMYVMDFYILNVFTVNFIQSDEKKNSAYFSVSTPESVNGVVWSKYVFVLLIAVFLMAWCFLLDSIVATVSGAIMNAQILYTILFYLHIFFSAIDLPFIFRFGAKAGTTYKGILFMAVLMGGIVYALFGDLSIFGSIDTFYEAVYGFISGENIPDSFWLAMGLFPFIAIGSYYASYKLSCKFYLKGVDTYAK